MTVLDFDAQLISKFAKIVASSTVHEEMDFASLLPEGPSLEDEDVDDLEGNIKGIKRGEVSAKKRQQTAENGQVIISDLVYRHMRL